MIPSTVMAGVRWGAPDGPGRQTGGSVDQPAGDGRILSMHNATVVVLPVRRDRAERTPEAVQRQRDAAREALRLCAATCEAPKNGWAQRPDGAPLANDGWRWSISHKRRWACAAISREAVGIDIEEIAARRVPLYDEIGNDEEWALLGGRNWPTFFRLWTMKEATLKANGVGIGALANCRLKCVIEKTRSVVTYLADSWSIEHVAIDNHIVAVATPS